MYIFVQLQIFGDQTGGERLWPNRWVEGGGFGRLRGCYWWWCARGGGGRLFTDTITYNPKHSASKLFNSITVRPTDS